MTSTIPQDIEQRFQGQWLAWDTETNTVVASGDSMKQVMDLAKGHTDRTGHLIWYHHVIGKDVVLVGGLW